MKTYEIKSSNIKSIGYDNESRILIVNFKNGTSYSYQDVPAEKVTTLLFSESTGKAFHANIKKYKFKKNDSEQACVTVEKEEDKKCKWVRAFDGHFNIGCVGETGERANGDFKGKSIGSKWEFVFCPYCGKEIEYKMIKEE